jgi:molecular chaperone GrpE
MSEKTEPTAENGANAEAAAAASAGPSEEKKADPAPASTGAAAVTGAPAVSGAPAGTGAGGDPLAEAKAEAQKNRENWVRTAADFDNFRKRARREVDEAKKSGREDLLKDFLPVFDNLERALQSAQRATEVKPVVDGLNMVMKQFNDMLGRSGITKVPTKGAQFDPTMHEAIQQVESDEPPGTVVAEVQGGYMQGDRLVRAALVVVSQPRANAEPAAGDAPAEKKDGDGAPGAPGATGGGGKDAPAEAPEGSSAGTGDSENKSGSSG